MAYDDKDEGRVFPTRTGVATGSANERTMLDELGGANGIRHRQRMGADGVTTHVKTRGGHPHFWNEPLPSDEESIAPIYMDSGVVDLISVNPLDPLSLLPSPLYYCNDQRAAFAAKKLLGKITPPSITNLAPPVDTVPGESFTPIAGGDLVGKKDCAAKCPPSMFTGKARLYAQAQLGAPLNKWGWTLDMPEVQAPQWVHDSTGFVLNINVGVYTDDTNKHWLISVSGSGVMVTPLKPSKSAKLLRQNLSDPAYTADKTKIEAYILAHSIPGGESESFVVDVSGIPPPYMLGYGWKFNWDGSRADIIRHVEGVPQHSSTHYQLSINRQTAVVSNTEASRWTFSVSVVEGPVYWHNSKFSDVICSPDWISNKLYTFGTVLGGRNGNAPVYCFYKDDGELEVFRYYGREGDAGLMWSSVSSPACWLWVFDWTADNAASNYQYELGSYVLGGASGERRTRTNSPTRSGFSCSQAQSIREYQSYTYTSAELGAKSFIVTESWTVSNTGFTAYETEYTLTPTGYALLTTTSDGVAVYTSAAVADVKYGAYLGGARGSETSYTTHLTYTRKQYNGSHVESLYTALIVPFHDAESAYMYGMLSTYRGATGTGGFCDATGSNGGTFYREHRYVFDVIGSDPPEYTQYSCVEPLGGGGQYLDGTPETVLDPIADTENDEFLTKLITRFGAFAWSPPATMNLFFAGDDYVAHNFYTHSACVGPEVYGYGAKNLNGLPDIFGFPPPFIGWI